MDPPASSESSLFGGSEVCLPDSATVTQLCRLFYQYAHCVCRCPNACRLFRTSPAACWCCSCPTIVQKLCYKLSIVVTFTFIQTSKFCLLYWMLSKLVHLLHTASKFALFLVSRLKDDKLMKKQTHMKTETCKLYSRGFWIFLPNIIKIDPYNFEIYRFKVGSFV